jgi:sterol regulatory element-binding transcription factor 1
MTTTNNNFGNGTGGRVRRKSSHNAIEKRYRSSINERILELKEIVSDNDEKVNNETINHMLITFFSIRYKNLVYFDVQLNTFDNFNQLIDD